MFEAVDFKIFIHFNNIKFKNNSLMSYQNISNSYIMETHAGEIY